MPEVNDKTTDANAAFRACIAADQLAAAECAERVAAFLRRGVPVKAPANPAGFTTG